MKRMFTVMLTMLFLVSGIYAEQNRDAVKAFKKARSLKASLMQGQTAITKTDNNVKRIIQSKRGVPQGKKTQAFPKTNLQLNSYVADKDRVTFSTKTAGLNIWLNEPMKDTLSYTIGDEIVFMVMSTEAVVLEFFIDDGDGVFDENSDFIMGGPDDHYVVQDGDEMDMDVNPGSWVYGMPTDMMMDGPFFGIENVLIYIRATEISTGNSGMAYAFSAPVDSDYIISGDVVMDDGNPASVLVMAMTFSDTMWYEDPYAKSPDEGPGMPPANAYAVFTDETGHYVIHVDSSFSENEFEVSPMDVMENYSGYFPGPPMAWTMPDTVEMNVDFIYSLGTSSISGFLTDENGVGIAGVEMWAHNWDNGISDITDTDGAFSFIVNNDDWYIDPNPKDLMGSYLIPWGANVWIMDGDIDTVLNIYTYATDGTITGNVSGSAGIGIAGVEVEAGAWDDNDYGFWTMAETDEDGNYELAVSSELDPEEICYDSTFCWMMGGYWVDIWFKDGKVTKIKQ